MPRERTPQQAAGEVVRRDIGTRWTPKLAAGGWTPIANAFLTCYGTLNPVITPVEAMFIVHLMMHKWDQRHPYPTFGTLAKQMGVSVSTARGYARSLQKKKYLIRVKQIGEANQFDLGPLFAAIEKVMPTPIPRRSRLTATAVVTNSGTPANTETAVAVGGNV